MGDNARFLSDTNSRRFSFSLDLRQIALLISISIALGIILFACGVVVGRWYGITAVQTVPIIKTPEIEKAQKENLALSFHQELLQNAPKPTKTPSQQLVEQEDTPDTDLPDLPEDQDTPSPPEENSPTEEEGSFDTPPSPERFTLQAGSFPGREKAEQLAKKLKKAGEVPYILYSEASGMYLVRLGAFATIKDAKKRKEKLQKNDGFQTMISSP